MSVIFLASTTNDFLTAPASSFSTETTTNGRDADYSPYELRVPVLKNTGNPFGIPLGAAIADLWVHFRVDTPSIRFNAASGSWFQATNADDDVLVLGDLNQDQLAAIAYGDTTDTGTYTDLNSATTITVDINIRVDGTEVALDIYINGTIFSSASAANTGALAAPTLFTFNNDDMTEDASQALHFSEIILTDGEDTRGWRLATLEPDGAGNYSDFDGDYSNLAGFNLASVAGTDTANDRLSSSLSAYGGEASPAGIRGVFAKAIAARGDTGPTTMKQFLRISSTDYEGSAESLGVSLSPYMEEWATNPAGGAWSTSDFASLEVGIKAEA